VACETAQTPLQMAALPSAEEFGAALLRANNANLAAGCTSVHDAGGLVGSAFGPCQDLVEAGRLKLRIYAFATVNSLQHPVMGVLGAGIRSGFGDERRRLGAFKAMTDGSSTGPPRRRASPTPRTARSAASSTGTRTGSMIFWGAPTGGGFNARCTPLATAPSSRS
jgi:predicted amidohydrolase YtcJ